MAFEEELIGTLIGGYSIVMGISVLVVLGLWSKYKKAAYTWFLAHFALFTWAIYFWLTAIAPSVPWDQRPDQGAMLSEQNSLLAGKAGLVWALSMFCLVMGIVSLSKKVENKSQS